MSPLTTPEWHDDVIHCPPDTERYFYGCKRADGMFDTDVPYVEIIRSSNTRIEGGKNSTRWCYGDQSSGNWWMELPPDVTTLEEAKATALLLWRMG